MTSWRKYYKCQSMNYKETIQLPRTDFPMRANLPEKETKILQNWNQTQMYKQIQESRKDNKPYIFHDGPPYANGHIHMGTAFNRILKDITVKYRTMVGYRVPFIPGWDCHGMPIEREVIKKLKGKILTNEILRKACTQFAQKFVGIQKEEFMRLGVFGEWDNPYITMDPEYEARVINVFKVLVEKGYVYRDKRPVHWCTSCKTALAEAELEYKDILSSSIYVKFKTQDPNLSILIWTTTPWTLPANVAIALNPKLQYDFVKIGNEKLVIASDLKDIVLEKLNIKDYEIEKSVVGKELEGMIYKHPLFDKECKVILSTFVSKDSGTGGVHIAPGHGYEDYQVGLSYKLPVISPVDESGCFTDEVPEFEGKYVFDANKDIIEALKEKETLVCDEEFSHSYPHCWRCKTPLIFRATPQWFLRIDHKNLRERCVNEIEKINWVPKWSKERILHNILDRPDWCLSRQRRWGIPIPVLYCKNCDTPILDTKVIERARDIIKKEGSMGWFEHPAKDFIETACPKCNCQEFIKEKDIFDVWFDSGASWTVIKAQDSFPADIYCEGVDHHRGWFQHSFLLSMTTEEKPCFKSVLTHGLILDKEMKKMSKSLGNVISPTEIIKKYGADILRLYFSAIDYTCDVPFDSDGLESSVIAYRRLRNTFKFLLGNLHDFETIVPKDKLLELDKLMLHRLTLLIEKVTSAYENVEFHKVYHSIYNYCTTDLSKFYLDILKDRLYTYGKNSLERRSAQTILQEILLSLVKLLAPIIPFTTEEVWQNITNNLKLSTNNSKSIHIELLPKSNPDWIDNKLAEDYELIQEIRDNVLLALEAARNKKIIGNTLEAKVTLWADNKDTRDFLQQKLSSLPSIFIVSQTNIEKVDNMSQFKKINIFIDKAEGKRCERCWIWSKDIGTSTEHLTLCSKCINVLKEDNYGC